MFKTAFSTMANRLLCGPLCLVASPYWQTAVLSAAIFLLFFFKRTTHENQHMWF